MIISIFSHFETFGSVSLGVKLHKLIIMLRGAYLHVMGP